MLYASKRIESNSRISEDFSHSHGESSISADMISRCCECVYAEQSSMELSKQTGQMDNGLPAVPINLHRA